MAGKANLELKVGIFVFIGLIILTLAVFSIGEIYIFRPGYFIKVVFSFASGVDVGQTVRVAGIDVGEIEDIELSYDSNEGKAKVILSVWLDGDVQIPCDSRAFLNTLGLVGERYLEIIPGQDYAHLLQDGDILIGRDPVTAENLLDVVHKVAANFDHLLGSANEVLDTDTTLALKETIHNFRDFSRSLKVISERLERGEGKLGAWLKPRKTSSKETTSKE